MIIIVLLLHLTYEINCDSDEDAQLQNFKRTIMKEIEMVTNLKESALRSGNFTGINKHHIPQLINTYEGILLRMKNVVQDKENHSKNSKAEQEIPELMADIDSMLQILKKSSE